MPECVLDSRPHTSGVCAWLVGLGQADSWNQCLVFPREEKEFSLFEIFIPPELGDFLSSFRVCLTCVFVCVCVILSGVLRLPFVINSEFWPNFFFLLHFFALVHDLSAFSTMFS